MSVTTREHRRGPTVANDERLNEASATRIANEAVEMAGGPRRIYRNPRMAYAFNATRTVEVEGHTVEIRYGEISSPAIATVEGWVFEIHDESVDLLIRPAAPKGA